MRSHLLRAAVGKVFLSILMTLVVFTLVRRAEESPHARGPAASTTSQQVLAELGSLLAQADPGSDEERELHRAIVRARRKLHQTEPRQENPGAFLEALAQIKTRQDGTTYRAGYRHRALEQSEMLRKSPSEALPWMERGPGNVAGRARAIIVDAADATGNTWLVANVGGGIWRTTDAGGNWQDLTPQLTTLSTTCLAQCTDQPDVLYAGTGMGYGRVVDLQGGGVWKSVDGGDTWQQLASTAQGQLYEAINRIVVDPDDPDVVVLCSNDQFTQISPNGGDRSSGIFRSEDGGVTWTQTFDADAVFGSNTDNRVQQIVANPLNFATLYATVNEVGVVKSIDGGQSWSVSADDFALASDIGNPPGGIGGYSGISVRTEMAIAPTDTSRLYAAVERPRGVADLYMSTDAGASWSVLPDTGVDPNWFNAFGSSGATGAYTAGWFDNTIVVHPFDEDIVYVGGVNLYRVDVNAQSGSRLAQPIAWWIPNAQGLPVVHADHHFLVAIPGSGPGGFRLLDANDGGIGVSNDGGVNWSQITALGTTQFYGADKKPGQDAYFGGMQDNGTWVSGLDAQANSNWSFAIGGDGFEVAWNQRDPDLLIGGSQGGNLSRSTDGGATWTPIPAARAGTSPFISKVGNNDTDPDLVFTVGVNGVMRSDDFGASWDLTPINIGWLGYRPFDDVEVSLAEPQNVWISSKTDPDPATGQRGGVQLSEDGGLSFRDVSASIPFAGTEASGIATHPLEPETAYLLYAAPGVPKVIRTEDLGATWEDLSGFAGVSRSVGDVSATGFPDVAVFCLLVMPFDVDHIWAGTEIGLFESLDSGQSWAIADNGLPNVGIFEMKIVDEQVVVATQGRGVWSVTLPELATWTPPAVTLAPRLSRLAMIPQGDLAIDVDRRSAYDSTLVFVDDVIWTRLGANATADTAALRQSIPVFDQKSVRVTAYRDGRAYSNASRTIDVYPSVATNRLEIDFESPTEAGRWIRSGFSLVSRSGFIGKAAHSNHRYAASVDYELRLITPIRVEEAGATLSYRDVVLVEPGVPGVPWTNANFFDYVVVEGSSDGMNWNALAPGYDSSADPAWLSVYQSAIDGQGNSLAAGNESLYRSHTIDLGETFAAGTLVFLRFRLHSDPSATGWGWAIDDIAIQPEAVEVDEPRDGPASPAAARTALAPNVPNPFNPVTEIHFSLSRAGAVDLSVFDLRGRKVRTLLRETEVSAGDRRLTWNATDDRGRRLASGTYFLRLAADGRVFSQKMTLLE